MANGEIYITVSNKSQNVGVGVAGGNNKIGITGDNSQYFSNEARKSAEQAKQSATEAKATLEETKTLAEEAQASIVAATENAQEVIITTKEEAIEEVEELLSKGTVTDVQANGTSVLTDGVANIPLATDKEAGLVRPVSANGIYVSNTGTLNLSKLSNASLANKTSNYAVLVSQIDLATKVGVTTNTIELTDEEKTNACNWLGAAKADTALNKSQITNCLLEVPQNIKLELNDGVLTLKAGSKVIVPNGAGVFDEVVITNDASLGKIGSYTGSSFFAYKRSTNQLLQAILSEGRSGATDSHAGTNGFWYDTANNKVLNYYNGGANVHQDVSLPFAIVHRTSGSWDKIEQIFNGMGYIGSTVWVDKGVKGLIPNGRNADGGLNNIEAHTERVLTYTNVTGVSSGRYYSFKTPVNGVWTSLDFKTIDDLNVGTPTSLWYFSETENKWLFDGNEHPWLDFAYSTDAIASPYKITSFKPKLPFRAVDYNDKSEISGWAMPSNKYINLTIGASGSAYTAPANGYFAFSTTTTPSANNYTYLRNQTTNMCFYAMANAGVVADGFLPAKKGDIITLGYFSSIINTFIFVYAESEV